MIFAKLPAVVLAALLTWLLSSPAVAATPSFPCAGNLTATEKVICADDNLAALDVALAATYMSKLENPGPRDYSLDDPRDAIPITQAAVYVKQCIAVAPETHPPCNALNTCEMIISHNIYRCFELGADAPKFCAAYPPPP